MKRRRDWRKWPRNLCIYCVGGLMGCNVGFGREVENWAIWSFSWSRLALHVLHSPSHSPTPHPLLLIFTRALIHVFPVLPPMNAKCPSLSRLLSLQSGTQIDRTRRFHWAAWDCIHEPINCCVVMLVSQSSHPSQDVGTNNFFSIISGLWGCRVDKCQLDCS
jgi:hypothetical protein